MMSPNSAIEIKTRPIIFNSDMVRAILDGRKSQTRRVIKPQPKSQGIKSFGEAWEWKKGAGGFSGSTLHQLKAAYGLLYHCPYGVPGERLWVRETFFYEWPDMDPPEDMKDCRIIFRADEPNYLDPFMLEENYRWSPSIHLPRWASRITLEIIDVRVERLHEITVGDLISEGVIELENAHIETYPLDLIVNRSAHYTIWKNLWDSIYAKRGYPFKDNSWVWTVEFKVLNG